MNVLLIGLRASGKSTVGRALAQRLNAPFIDLDEAVLADLGAATVAEAWATLGQAAFRAAETRALARATGQRAGAVVALGGGAPTAPGAAELIERERATGRARVVYLRCDPGALRDRLARAGGAGADRPSLTGADPLEEIEAVFRARDPLYRALADLVVENAATVEDALEKINALDW